MTNKKRNLVVSVLFLAFGIFLFVQAMGVKHMMKNDVGSGFFPKVIAVAIIAVSLIRLIMALKEEEKEAKKANSDMLGGWMTIVLVGLYVLAFNEVGFLISTVIYLFLQMLVLTPTEKRSLPLLGTISVAAPGFIYALFVYAINTPLPTGLFGF